MKKFLAKYMLRSEHIVITIPDKIEAPTINEAWKKANKNKLYSRSDGWVLLFLQEVNSVDDVWALL